MAPCDAASIAAGGQGAALLSADALSSHGQLVNGEEEMRDAAYFWAVAIGGGGWSGCEKCLLLGVKLVRLGGKCGGAWMSASTMPTTW